MRREGGESGEVLGRGQVSRKVKANKIRLMKIAPRFSRFVWKEFLRGPLGTPFLLGRGVRPVARFLPLRSSSLRLWRRLSVLPIPAGAKRFLYRAFWVLPFGPGDPATPARVVRRHRAFFAHA